MTVTIIIPVYNEKNTTIKILKKVQKTKFKKEIIIVDDGSTDGTTKILQKLKTQKNLKIFFHRQNLGKGAAIRTALNHVSGDCVIIQDSDLEYDPQDIEKLLKPLKEGKAEVVYGSRFTGERRNMFFWHFLGNQILTLFTNILFNTTLSDMETGYKLFKSEIIKGIKFKANRFDFEPEITARILKKQIRIYEVPISYAGREYHEGKKITSKDGIIAFLVLLRYRFLK
jgi:glycosyltransferase involved in cell wall biosynthesis